MLKGKAKTDYQREYMRKLRLKGKMLDPAVRPIKDRLEYYREGVEPPLDMDADGNPVYDDCVHFNAVG